MPFPSQCPVCRTVLEFPDYTPSDPVRCPVCNTRYKIEGRMVAQLSFSDYYELLGTSPDADASEIKKSIRAAILKHHPDRNPGDPGAELRIRAILKAKELLTDTNKRKMYDSVYHARALKIWTKERIEPDRGTAVGYTKVQGESDGTRQRGEHFYTYDDTNVIAGPTPSKPRPGDPDTYPRQEVILVQGGVPINLSSKRARRDYYRIRGLWQLAGSVIGALAGIIFGMMNGSLPGALVLALIGAFAGWLFTSYPGGLVVIVFFIARMFVVGLILAIGASKYATGIWFPHGFIITLKVIQFTTSAGALALGLWSISASRFIGYEPYTVHAASLKAAAVGAWLGAIVGLFVLLVQTGTVNVAYETTWYWFIMMTLWLILDTSIFGRTWVLIRNKGE